MSQESLATDDRIYSAYSSAIRAGHTVVQGTRGNQCNTSTTSNARLILGVAKNGAAAADDPIQVQRSGICLAMAGGVVTSGKSQICSTTAGKVYNYDTTSAVTSGELANCVGIALESTTADNLFKMVICPHARPV